MHLLVLVIRLSAAAIQLQDEVSCPDSAAVMAQLRHLSPQTVGVDYVAHLRQSERGLVLELDDRQGAQLASRPLPLSSDCAQLAEVVAVTLAAWEAQFTQPEVAPAPVTSQTGRAVRPATDAGFAEAEEVPKSPGSGVELSALVLATGDSQGAGAVAELGVAITHFVALLLVDSPHGTSFGPGQLHWQRSALGMGGVVGVSAGRWDFDGRGLLLGALLARWGNGYPINEQSFSVDFGLDLGATVSLRLGGGWSILAELSGVLWPATQQMVVGGVSGSFTLPVFQLFLGLGVGVDVL